MAKETKKTFLQQATTKLTKESTNIILILLLIIILLQFMLLMRNNTSNQLQQRIIEQEVAKLGGRDNYQTAQQIYQSSSYQREQSFVRKQQAKAYLTTE